MSVSAPVASKANGISTVVNTIAAPNEAFDTLAVAPTWGWALVIAIVLMLVGVFLEAPAARHTAVATMQHMLQTNPYFASQSAEQKQKIMENAGKPNAFSYIMPVVILFIAALFNTIFMLIGNAAGKGRATFKTLWAGSMNIAVPTIGLSMLVTGIITMLRGADSFNSQGDLARAVPGLGMIAPHTVPAIGGFLAGVTLFTLWGAFLNSTMLQRIGKVSPGIAWTFAVIVLLLGGAFGAVAAIIGAKFGMA